MLLWTDDRLRIRLAEPSALRGIGRVDAVVALIGRHWLAHRAPGWVPAWPVPPAPLS